MLMAKRNKIVSIEGIGYDVRIREISDGIPTLNKEDNLKGDEDDRLSDLNEYEENDCDKSEECMPKKNDEPVQMKNVPQNSSDATCNWPTQKPRQKLECATVSVSFKPRSAEKIWISLMLLSLLSSVNKNRPNAVFGR
ncbi:hypothetical protein L1887_11209 [Cichorium endivia]|nr:hypothetical protein L1887_11209 [Cichorium endivia]